MKKRLILTIVISILILISFSLMIYSKISSETEILKKLDEMNYYDHAYEDILKKLKGELPNSELSYVYEKYVTKARIKKDIKNILDNHYNKEDNGIKKNFYDHVFKEFGSKDDENIKSLCNSLADTYYNNLFRIDKLDKFVKLMPLKNSARGLAFIFLFVTIFLIALAIKNMSIYNSFIVSGLIFLLPKCFILIKDIFKNFYYFNDGITYFIKMYGYSIINTYFKYGLLLLAIGIIGIIIKLFRKANWLKMSNDI